jgi:hypothetical protein
MVAIKTTQTFNMKLENFLEDIIEEQNYPILKISRNRPLVDAIVNRHPITFYYTGPRKPKKKSVKAGYRVKAEPVAMGSHKTTGNLLVRAYIDDPSASKRGTPGRVGKEKSNYGWRTFLASRMSRVEVLKDETFDTPREKFNGGGDDKTMGVTYVSTDFSTTPPKPRIGDTKKPESKAGVEPKPIEPKKPTITKQARNVDAELKQFDKELEQIEKDIKTSLENYKKSKNSPKEIEYVNQLKDFNKKKNELLNRISDTITNIGTDVSSDDKSKINRFTSRVSSKKPSLDVIVPEPTKKPTKEPNKPDEPDEKGDLPKIPTKEKPKTDMNSYDLNESYIQRIKKLISYI